MAQIQFDENEIKKLPLEERLEKLTEVFNTSNDESIRWDAVWLSGEIAAQAGDGSDLFNKVADLYSWVLKHDDNTVVRHEVCYQIAGRNMRQIIPDLIESGLHDESSLVRHEAIECLSIIQANDPKTLDAFHKAAKDPDKHVRDTAYFVLKRYNRILDEKYDPTTSAY